MKLNHPLFCVCIDCAVVTAAAHRAADAACGRAWLCSCGACRRARDLADIEARLDRIAARESRPASSASGWRQVGPRRRCHTCSEILSLARGFWSQWVGGKENRYYCARCYILAVEAEAEARQRERGGG